MFAMSIGGAVGVLVALLLLSWAYTKVVGLFYKIKYRVRR